MDLALLLIANILHHLNCIEQNSCKHHSINYMPSIWWIANFQPWNPLQIVTVYDSNPRSTPAWWEGIPRKAWTSPVGPGVRNQKGWGKKTTNRSTRNKGVNKASVSCGCFVIGVARIWSVNFLLVVFCAHGSQNHGWFCMKQQHILCQWCQC